MKRRDFLTAGALAGTLALPESLRSEEKEQGKEPPTQLDLLTELVRRQYGDLLDEEQIAEVRRQIGGNLGAARSISSYPIDNGDGPVLAPSSIYRLEKSR